VLLRVKALRVVGRWPPQQPGAGWLAGVAARRVATRKARTARILVTLLVSDDVAPI